MHRYAMSGQRRAPDLVAATGRQGHRRLASGEQGGDLGAELVERREQTDVGAYGDAVERSARRRGDRGRGRQGQEIDVPHADDQRVARADARVVEIEHEPTRDHAQERRGRAGRAPTDTEQCGQVAMVDHGTAFEIGGRTAEGAHEAEHFDGFPGHDGREAERSGRNLVGGGEGILRGGDAGTREVEQIDPEPVDGAQLDIELPRQDAVDGAVQMSR
jgi:hypothetical protein